MTPAEVCSLLRSAIAPDTCPDGIVVPATKAWRSALIEAHKTEAPFIERMGSFLDDTRCSFCFEGVPIFFAGEDDGIEPFAVSRRLVGGVK